MSTAIQCAAAVLAMLFATSAHARDQAPVRIHLQADITIEPDGTLSRLDWHHADKMPAVLRGRIDRHVGTWSFEPGAVGGTAGRTQSSLNLTLEAAEREGALTLRVLEASTGARLEQTPVPAYPREALRKHEEGAVLARFEAQPGGARTVHIEGYAGDARLREAFTDAVEAMFDDVDVRHEMVDGRPAPASFVMPVTFCMGAPDCHEDAFPDAPRNAGPAGGPVPVASVARLVTEVTGVGI